MSDEPLTETEIQQYKEIFGYGANVPEGKHNVHTFLHNVVTANDTTKLGVLTNEELGSMSNPIRSFKHLGLFAKTIMKKEGLGDFFNAQSEIGTSTSLSRNGTLVKLAVVQHRKIEDVTKEPKQNKGWFKQKDDKQDQEMQS